MSVEVAVTGNGRYAGSRSSVGDYTVLEESTAIEASDSSGGTGQISFSAIDDPSRTGSMLLLNDTVELTDGARGMTQGKINDIQGVNGAVAITADSRLGRLVIDATSPGVNGTFGDAVFQYLALGGITDNIAIDSTLSTIPVVIPGWTGDLWRKINDLMVAYGAEIALVRAQVVVRKVRTRKALEINNISPTWRALNSEVAQNVEVAYYNTQYCTNALVYPQGGWNDSVTVYTVEAGQTLSVNIPVNITLKSLIQPNVVDLVSQLYAGPSSMYSVIGSDGTAILATEWTAGGGSIRVAIGKDGKSIDATIQGAQGSISQYSPFRIAVNRGVNDYYSSLRISGTGIFYDRKTVVVPTGADANLTSREVGATVDNVHVQTEGQARSLALDVASRWASPRRTLSLKKVNVNKLRDTQQNFDAATFQDFDTQYPSLLFSDFDTLFAGKTFAQFDQAYYDSVNTQYDFQVFGNANGSRFQWRRNMYRIRSARITAGEVDLESEVDTTIGDFDALTPKTPKYTWTEQRRNYFPDPYATSLSSGGWGSAASGSSSLVTDFPNAINAAYRHTRTSTSTAGLRLLVGTTLPTDADIRVRFKYRSTAQLSGSVRVRANVDVSTGEIVLASPTIWPGTGEIDVVGQSLPAGTVLNASTGVTLIWSGGAVGDTLDITDVSIEVSTSYGPWTEDRRNLHPNPEGVNGAGWAAQTDFAQSVGPDGILYTATAANQVARQVGGSATGTANLAPFVAGNTYYGSVVVVTQVTRNLRASINFRNSAGSEITNIHGDWVTVQAGVPTSLYVTGVAPDGATWGGVRIWRNSDVAITVGEVIGINRQTISLSPGPGFSGATPYSTASPFVLRYRWDGNANASQSVQESRQIAYQLGTNAKPFNPNATNTPTLRTRWVGTPNASQSVLETGVQNGTAVMTFASFDEMYAGLTFDDFSLIPLPNVLPEYDRS